MTFTTRQEISNDYQKVSEIIEEAFRNVEMSDHKEHFLVERLRNSDAFIAELSIVAENENEIAGHILLTEIKIKNGSKAFDSLALAPLSVKPNFQKQGIGGKLIKEAHKKAKELGFTSIVLLGHEDYYPKFGYELTSKYGISLPFDVPEKNCMVIELSDKGLEGVSGIVEYSKAFFE